MKRITLIITLTLIILSAADGLADNSSASYTMVSCVLNSSGSSGQTSSFTAITSAGEPAINLFIGQDYSVKAGFIYTTIPYILSISIEEPKSWEIRNISVNSVATMSEGDKILITNDGTDKETLELRLINPANWLASNSSGNERYVLSGLFCGAGDTPEAGAFNVDDVISTSAKKATDSIFGYSASAANGVALPCAAIRALYLQFKSPALTQRKDEQQVSVIISCQTP